MVYYFLLMYYFQNIFNLAFSILKSLKDILQHSKFVNWWIRGFVFLMSRTGYTIDFWPKKVQKIEFFISFPHENMKKNHPKIAEIFSTALVAQNNKSTRLICAFIVLGVYNFVQRWKNCSEITAWSSINLGVRILFLSNWLGKIDEIGRGYKKSCQSNEGKENKVIKPLSYHICYFDLLSFDEFFWRIKNQLDAF